MFYKLQYASKKVVSIFSAEKNKSYIGKIDTNYKVKLADDSAVKIK